MNFFAEKKSMVKALTAAHLRHQKKLEDEAKKAAGAQAVPSVAADV